MIGPAGYGTSNFVAAGTLLPYEIEFENASTATAPAQRVDITDQLDPNLDWTTFQLTAVGFGSTYLNIPTGLQHYDTTVNVTENGQTFEVAIALNLNPATGLLTASYQSIDPKTHLPPASLLTGFLPPEDGSGRGTGYVNFTISPKPTLSTGTAIRNVALIAFDQSQSIATDQVNDDDPSQGTDPTREALVTIDAGPPTSSVTALPATEDSASFTVNWSGTDDTGGSGIATFDIFVSDNGGTFTLWQSFPGTQTSASYTGQGGHSYGFYSVASDNVGNAQPTPTTAQASTLVLIQTGTGVTSDQSTGSLSGQSVTFTATVSTVPAGQGTPTGTVTFLDGSTTLGTDPLSGGVATFSIATLTPGSHNITASYGTTSPFGGSTSTTLVQVVNQTPAITTQPANQSAVNGSSVTFTAAASGTPTPTVQWQVSTDGGTNYTNVNGATSALLTFTTSAVQTGNLYEAVFTNSVGSVTSNPATLTVNTVPAITTQPTNQSATAGDAVTFTAAASGTPAPTVQWQVSTDGTTYTNVSGGYRDDVELHHYRAQTGNLYEAVFSNVAGSVTTNPVTLTVNSAPAVTLQPANQSVTAGNTATFTTAASGSPTPTVQWQVSTDNGPPTPMSLGHRDDPEFRHQRGADR